MRRQKSLVSFALPMLMALLSALVLTGFSGGAARANVSTTTSLNTAFTQASQESGVPISILKALCYMEGRLSNHAGHPSLDGGYGCMHLIQNERGDTLTQAAKALHVDPQQLKSDSATNIRGGAAVLRDEAIQLSPSHTLPGNLGDWYGTLVAYSHATTHSTALMYADALFKIVQNGFSAPNETGEVVTLAPESVKVNKATAKNIKAATTIPSGCQVDANVDYPGAVDCILDPNAYDCTPPPAVYPYCTYESANRPTDLSVNYVVIHDTETSLQGALNVFQSHTSGVSIHYIVDTDGTVYELLHDKDFAYHVGNYWYNQHSVGIENIGYDATGFLWYNAAQYLASAKLTAYLVNKYNIPLDHDHIVSHGTVPSPGLSTNHVDPGPYWLWTYYLNLVQQQSGAPFTAKSKDTHIITLKPSTDKKPLGKNGTETPANFNFFYLYTGPSTQSARIPQLGDPTDVTDETNNVETNISYYYLAKVKDPAGTGDTLYEIWYGESDQAHSTPSSLVQSAHLAWLAVPPGAAVEGQGTAVTLNDPSGTVPIYGKPQTGATVIATAPSNAVFVSGYTFVEDGTTNLWYEINYNHRQAWVPASAITPVQSIKTGN
ncbi:peptidoglycan recognition protein family protein [Ktedonobacter racemifer]|uniref:N-acetylmuramoyl-L-alanine amidase n=1 Tax=Ktedonobacter racemifer DSM 44963 TaxID=485913 RepID=D6TUG8_KTERA|nr:peptidoglycan recognition family protein [Ktedonobacter racemifer]EFH84036.1 N-acetylmuramyl-L-alanine amidase, negative regulator of AmpC, AmpD [Ktedonobacter racemifer DSM 44963]